VIMTHHQPRKRSSSSLLRLALLIGALLAWTNSATMAADDATRWDGDARSAARLVAGSQPAADGVLRAGLEIRLKSGWHTYWRYPGDAGVPPQFDFAASQNLKRAVVLWPAPQRIEEAGGGTIGYIGNILFPLRVEPIDPAKPVLLRLKLDYAICEKLCVPAEAKAELAIGKSVFKGATSQDGALVAAEARVPRMVKLAADGPLAIKAVRRDPGTARPRVLVDVVASGVVDLFAEGPTPQWALPLPTKVDGAPAGQQRFAFELDGLPPGASDQGVLLTFTATTADDAIEVATRLD
jgi:DsbC/DsbD-like thiol-disulfide interchange protein